VFQFATSIILIIGTVVIYKQLHYIQTKDLGFNKDQVLVINHTGALKNNSIAFKNAVLQLSGVSSGTISGFLPVSNSSRSDYTFSKESVLNFQNGLDMQTWQVDYDYLKTMGIRILKGRNFSREFGNDSSAIVINESTAALLGYPDPIGKFVYRRNGNETKAYHIIGVVKNFNYESLRQEVGPLCFLLEENPGAISFRISTANVSVLIGQIENKWKEMAPSMPFSYQFLDKSFDAMYRVEQRVGEIAMIFSILAIVIACLGLFGLATFIAEQKTKEIGIRKVLGASVQGIIRLLSGEFLKLVGISFVIAAPFAWWAMNTWLSDFAYRIMISWWIFAVAGLLALFIALLTVSFQAVRAALANPVKSLHSE
jgi:putative ABC transport system permease protein